MKHLFVVLALVCQSSVWAHSVDQGYRVVQTLDGNTVKISGEDQELTCRLHGIDVPEKDLMFGQASRESLSNLVHARDVHVHVINTVGRNILGCRLFVDGKDLSREQVRRGMAWKRPDITVDAQLLHAENNAKAGRRGLWSEADAATPVQ